MERGRWISGIDVWMKFVGIRLDKRRFFQLRVYVEISKAYPVVKHYSRSSKNNSKRPEIELDALADESDVTEGEFANIVPSESWNRREQSK